MPEIVIIGSFWAKASDSVLTRVIYDCDFNEHVWECFDFEAQVWDYLREV